MSNAAGIPPVSVVELKPRVADAGFPTVFGRELIQELPYEDFSGDWQQATFAKDFRHIVIGTPYEIIVHRRTS